MPRFISAQTDLGLLSEPVMRLWFSILAHQGFEVSPNLISAYITITDHEGHHSVYPQVVFISQVLDETLGVPQLT